MTKRCILLLAIVSYVLLFFYLAVLGRDSMTTPILKLELFWSYRSPGNNTFMGSCQNILCFVFLGVMVGLYSNNNRICRALFVGLFVSMATECSQLIWNKGVFDVDDLFNNSLGSVLGGLIAILVWKLMNKSNDSFWGG